MRKVNITIAVAARDLAVIEQLVEAGEYIIPSPGPAVAAWAFGQCVKALQDDPDALLDVEIAVRKRGSGRRA